MRRFTALAITMVFLLVIYAIGWSSLLTVSSLTIETSDPKNVSLIEGQLKATGLAIAVGEPIARINSRAIERSLKRESWIGEVSFERDWIRGDVRLFVREEIPRFILREEAPLAASAGVRFMSSEGVIFRLPGDLSNQYQSLPGIELRGGDSLTRAQAVRLFDLIHPIFPTEGVVVTPLATFTSESRVPASMGREDSKDGRSVRISWGAFSDIETKLMVIDELLDLKANRSVIRIDVSNPQLPIVSNR
jgi:hypothetical protein